MNRPCGCCEGVHQIVPEDTSNRPGLSAIRYRIGTHSSFLETMKARLANFPLAQEVLDRCLGSSATFPLAGLRTRDGDDPAIALLDAWALVADVLTFYQERIANEGYLRTATENLSVVELAKLIGYDPRPGVASSVRLAYTLEKDSAVDILAGSRAQSIPGPGELPQSFETSVVLSASDVWNNLQPRMTQPQKLVPGMGVIYAKGVTTNLKANDRLLFDFHNGSTEIRRIVLVEPDNDKNWTKITLQLRPQASQQTLSVNQTVLDAVAATPNLTKVMDSLIAPITKPPAQHPANSLRLPRDLKTAFSPGSEVLPRAVAALRPEIETRLYAGLETAQVTATQKAEVLAFRVRASAFGHNAPLHQNFGGHNQILPPSEWPLHKPVESTLLQRVEERLADAGAPIAASKLTPTEDVNRISLDAVYDKILPGSWIYLERPNADLSGPQLALLSVIGNTAERSRADYGITGKITEIALDPSQQKKWIDPNDDLSAVRSVAVFAQSEPLPLADQPIEDPVGGGSIELDGVYPGLESGRWLIVAGERNDVPKSTKIADAELVMLAGADLEANPAIPGDSLHSFINLASGGLAYSYVRSTVKIYGNVVDATQGESRNEVLGSGDATQPLQEFPLRQSPLTYVAAVTPSGIESTLQVRVNDILWQETDQVAALGPADRAYLTQTDDSANTTVVFGNGLHGARIPTGVENVKAAYRVGIGSSGNVDAGQITLLATKPLGVKEVINPIRASGGADRDGRDQTRRNAPVAVMALDRLVSIQDYADFARSFAGIGKASSVSMAFQGLEMVHVTVAGAENASIDSTSDLFQNLVAAFLKFGDPQQPVQLGVAETLLLVIQASVAILPDYEFESVVPNIRAALLATFGFDSRSLGQSVAQSEVISAIQNVEGVSHVQLTALSAAPETDFTALAAGEVAREISAGLARLGGEGKKILPAQVVFLTPDVTETLVLTELKDA
jgi:predicted phage baseplate assembly protein